MPEMAVHDKSLGDSMCHWQQDLQPPCTTPWSSPGALRLCPIAVL